MARTDLDVQRWQRHRAVELAHREQQEMAAFKVMISKFVPPTIVLDPVGDEISLAQPVGLHDGHKVICSTRHSLLYTSDCNHTLSRVLFWKG